MLEENPFFVLGLPPTCTRAEAEREAQKLLGQFELGVSAAASYQSPFGVRVLTRELIRTSIAELRVPQRRLLHELWAHTHIDLYLPRAAQEESDALADGWPGARRALGWGP